MSHAVNYWPVIVESRVRSHASPCETSGEPSGTGTGFCLSTVSVISPCSTLISILILHLSDGQAGKVQEPANTCNSHQYVCPTTAGCVWVVDRVSPHAINNHVKCEYSDYMWQICKVRLLHVLRVTDRRSLKMKGSTDYAMLMALHFFATFYYTVSQLQDYKYNLCN
jgi:hypothetical protein